MTINLDATAGLALDAITAYSHADNPSAFLAVNDGNSYFRVPGLSGLVVYRPAGRYLVQFGGPRNLPSTAVKAPDLRQRPRGNVIRAVRLGMDAGRQFQELK